GDESQALTNGCDAHITKPVSRPALLEAINVWSSPVDPIALGELRALDTPGEEPVLNILIEQFLNDLGPRLTALKKAWSIGDTSKLRITAHTIKGSCGNFGANRMARLCAYLDRSDREISPDCYTAIADLENEAVHVRPILVAQLERTDAALHHTDAAD